MFSPPSVWNVVCLQTLHRQVSKMYNNEFSLHKLQTILEDPRAEPPDIPLQYLREITNNFSHDREIGNGGFGVVYKGVESDGTLVAVKNLRSISQFDDKKFKNEVDNLMRVRHKNIVGFLGYCYETQQKYIKYNGENIFAETPKRLLCFEYMPKGSLDKYISDESHGLNWQERYKIIKGICYGLNYLHNECHTDGSSIIHLDLKPENVLLDHNFAPKIADFGLAKFFDNKKSHAVATSCVGSLGYMAPEYISEGLISSMADIYSLGIIILQVITGQKYGPSSTEALHRNFAESVLINWRKRLESGVSGPMYASLETDYQQIDKCLEIGMSCIQFDRKKRPAISEIINRLNRLEQTHCYVSDDGRRHANQAVQGIRERLYGEDSVLRMDDIYTDLNILERTVDGSEEPSTLKLPLLKFITDNFSGELQIGHGGCGVVYKGILPDGVVAVKRLFHSHTIDDNVFHQEVKSMMMVKHQNTVRFLGCCSHKEIRQREIAGRVLVDHTHERLLCFEYISNGSLKNHLTGGQSIGMRYDELRGLTWKTRYQIIKGICAGLNHLLQKRPIIHIGLEPGNILLDDHMVPKITGFGHGTTSLLPSEYRAPECLHHGEMSVVSSIYTLGVIVLELVTGSKEKPSITKVLRRWKYRWDKSAKHTPLGYLQVTKCIDLALRCMHPDPMQRPDIWNIICELKEIDSLEMEDMLGIEPLEVHLPYEHNKQMSGSIMLTNNTDYYIAFSISTTSLSQYCIDPNNDIVPPRSKCTVTITLQGLEKLAPPYNYNDCRVEFSVCSTRVEGSCTAMDITGDIFDEELGRVVDNVPVILVLHARPQFI
ncbi:hypothetical protein ACP4OV_028096 [Aristida adscensionis]